MILSVRHAIRVSRRRIIRSSWTSMRLYAGTRDVAETDAAAKHVGAKVAVSLTFDVTSPSPPETK